MGSRCVSPPLLTAMQSRHCPRNGVFALCFCSADESDTSLKPEHLLLFVHDVAEGNIGGNLCACWAAAHPSFSAFPPSSLLD